MNSDLFLFAKLPLSDTNKKATWLIDDSQLQYTAIDAIDFPDEYLDQVFSLYQATYAVYTTTNIKPLISQKEQLFKYNRWIMFFDEADPDEKVVMFCLFKTTPFGLKSALTGSDGVSITKRSLILFKIGSFNSTGVFGEISGLLENKILKDVPTIPLIKAKKVLLSMGKSIHSEGPDDHYSRKIGALGIVTKIMVGSLLV